MPLRDYLEGLNRGHRESNATCIESSRDSSSELVNDGAGAETVCLATARAANESVYLFGGNYSPGW